jgi:hypothetical protein
MRLNTAYEPEAAPVDPRRRPAAAAAPARDARYAPAPQHQDDDQDLYEQGHGFEDRADGYQDQGYEDQADDGYADGEYDEDGYEEEGYEEEQPRSRRGLIVVGALVAAVAIGGGLGFVYKLTSESSMGDKPKVVKADTRKVKAAPEEEGGKIFAGGTGKQVYERLDGTSAEDGEAQVTSSEEDLINRNDEGADDASGLPGISLGEETAQKPKKRKAVAEADTAAEDEAGGSTPRKVQPVLIKPGETITEDSAPLPGVAVVPTSAEDGAEASVGEAIGAVKKKKAVAAALEENAGAADDLAAAEASGEDLLAAATQKVAKKKQQVQAALAAEDGTAEQPAVAATTKKKVAAASTEPETTASTGGAGGYVVQVRASTSRMDALGSFADMQQKYGDLLTAGQPDIQEFAKGDQTWYRLRIGPPASKQAAATLCTKLKASGLKECIVTRY